MIWTALILGFAGSLHCIGMCSPLAMAATNPSAKVIHSRMVYHVGRILVYGFLGALVASVGFAFHISKYQNIISIVLGTVLIVAALTNRLPLPSNKPFARFNIRLKIAFSKFLGNKDYFSIFLLGVLNGFLPCGLVFIALTYCVISPTPVEGFVFMLLFGLGTLPSLVGFATLFNWATGRLNFRPQIVMPLLQALAGLVLIVRVFMTHTSPVNNFIDIVLCRM